CNQRIGRGCFGSRRCMRWPSAVPAAVECRNRLLSSDYCLLPCILSPLILLAPILSPATLSPDILSPDILSPHILSPDISSPDILPHDTFSPALLSPALFPPAILSPAILSPCILSLPAFDEPQPTTAKLNPQATNSAATANQILRMIKLLCCPQGKHLASA